MSETEQNNDPVAVKLTKADQQKFEAEQLADAINHSAGIARGLFLAFIFFAAFLLVTTSTTNDYDLLLQTPIQLPIFNVSVDLPGFYRFAPWAFFLAHANMMMILVLISRKLAIFHSKLSIQPYATRELLRARLHVFAPLQFLTRQHSGMMRVMLWVTSRVLLVWMPPALILWLQIDALAMQDSLTVWTQRFAVLADALMTYFLWSKMLQGRARPLAEVRLPGSRRPVTRRQKWNKFSTAMVMLFILSLSFFGATIPLSEWEQKTAWAWGDNIECDVNAPYIAKNYPLHCNNPISRVFFDGLMTVDRKQKLKEEILRLKYLNADIPSSESREVTREELIEEYSEKLDSGVCRLDLKLLQYLPLCWFAGSRWLDKLPEEVPNRIVTTNQLTPDLQNSLHLQRSVFDNKQNETLMNQIIGVELSERSFVKADFSNLLLPKANLSQSKLQGADLDEVKLQSAILSDAQLQGVSLNFAQLQGAHLNRAELQGGSLYSTQLQNARLGEAQLQNARLSKAQLQGARLVSAQLQGASLDEAQLQGAELLTVQLQGANLYSAQFQGGQLYGSQFQGASLVNAQLQGANLDSAQLQGARLYSTQFQGAILENVNLLYATLIDTSFSSQWPGRDKFIEKMVESTFDSKLKQRIVKQLNEYLDQSRSITQFNLVNEASETCIAIELNGDQKITEQIYQFCNSVAELKFSDHEKKSFDKNEIISQKMKLTPVEKHIQRSEYLCKYRRERQSLHAYLWSKYKTIENVILAPNNCAIDERFSLGAKPFEVFSGAILDQYFHYAKVGALSSINCQDLSYKLCLEETKQFLYKKAGEFLQEQEKNEQKN